MNLKSTTQALIFAITPIFIAESLAEPQETVRHNLRPFFPYAQKTGEIRTSHSGQAHWGDRVDYGWRSYNVVEFESPQLITEIRWSGIYYDFVEETAGDVNTVDWSVGVFSDRGGEPDEELFSETRKAEDVPTEVVGEIHRVLQKREYNDTIYRFEFRLSEPFLAEANTRYWFSPVSAGETFNPIFTFVEGHEERRESLRALSSVRTGGPSWQGAIMENTDEDFGELDWDPAITLIGRPANDADQDGMDDAWELEHGLDPNADDASADPDEDGAANIDEFERRSDPMNPDTDGDGLSDGVEQNGGQYVDGSNSGSSPLLVDTDRDGIPDGSEVPGATGDSTVSSSDPNYTDTDGDGYGDFVEWRNRYDAMDAANYPEPIVLGTGTEALRGGDLTDPEDDADPDAMEGYNAIFDASYKPEFTSSGAFNVFDNKLDGGSKDKWCCAQQAEESHWVAVTFDEEIVLGGFTVSSANTTPSRDPRIWEIQGKGADGEWETIFLRDRMGEALWTERNQVIEFKAGLHYKIPAAYKEIRFDTSGSNREDRSFQLGELEFFALRLPLEFTHIAMNPDGNIDLVWKSVAGATYGIDHSSDLQQWAELSDGYESQGEVTRYSGRLPEDLPVVYFRVRKE